MNGGMRSWKEKSVSIEPGSSSLVVAHLDQAERSGVATEGRLVVAPGPPDVAPTDFEGSRGSPLGEEDKERSIPQKHRGLQDGEVGRDGCRERVEQIEEVRADLLGSLRKAGGCQVVPSSGSCGWGLPAGASSRRRAQSRRPP